MGGVELWGELRGVQGGIGGCLRAVLQGYEGSMGRVSGGGESMGPMGPRPFFNRPRPLSTGPAPGLSPAPCGRSGRERSWGRTQGVCGERWIGGSPCQAPPPCCAARPMRRWEGRPRPPAPPAWCCPRRCPTPPSSPSPPKCSEWAGLRVGGVANSHWTEVVCGRGLRCASRACGWWVWSERCGRGLGHVGVATALMLNGEVAGGGRGL